jgi:hypothetical protein
LLERGGKMLRIIADIRIKNQPHWMVNLEIRKVALRLLQEKLRGYNPYISIPLQVESPVEVG